MMKEELINSVRSKTGVSYRQAKLLINAVFESISDSLEQGEPVTISGFGIFEVKERSARHGRNSQTGEFVTIEAKQVPNFKASEVLKKRIADSGL